VLFFLAPQAVRARLADVAPHLGQLDTVQPPLWLNGEYFKVRGSRAKPRVAVASVVACAGAPPCMEVRPA